MPHRVNALTDRPSLLVIGSSSGVTPEFTASMWQAGHAVCDASVGGTRAWVFDDTVLDSLMGVDDDHGFTHAFLQVGINANGAGATSMCQSAIDLAWRLKARGIPYVAQKVWKPHTTTDGWTTVAGQAPHFQARGSAVTWLGDGAPVSADGLTYAPRGRG